MPERDSDGFCLDCGSPTWAFCDRECVYERRAKRDARIAVLRANYPRKKANGSKPIEEAAKK